MGIHKYKGLVMTIIKKYALVIVSVFIVSVTTYQNIYANHGDNGAIGLSVYSTFSENIGGVFNFKFDDVPLMFGIGVGKILDENTDIFLEINVTTDWWIMDIEVLGPFHLYLGLGTYYNFDIHEADRTAFDLDLGFRFPVGLSTVLGPVELYAEIAPGIHVLQAGTRQDAKFFTGGIFRIATQGGIRIWF